jgi:haloalkane dehalogenase
MTTRPGWVNDELFPFESRFAEVGGAQVHYIDEGDGPVFLGLHGTRPGRSCTGTWCRA